MSFDLRQQYPLPAAAKPIVIIGAGGIVNDAHLPAYRKAAFPVAGVFDVDAARASAVAQQWAIPRIFPTLQDAAAMTDCVFDVAAPPVAHLGIVAALPKGAAVLVQKPLGLDLAEATRIRAVCRERALVAAVNFQLRFAPMMLAVADAIGRGSLGRLLDIEVHLNLATPWNLFAHLKPNPRVEIVSHSIHYLDLIHSALGHDAPLDARFERHVRLCGERQRQRGAGAGRRPDDHRQLQLHGQRRQPDRYRGAHRHHQWRERRRNHHHDFGRRFQDACLRFEGDRGAAVVKLGLLLNYPAGEPDELWIASAGDPWQQIPLAGAWFPDAFIGTMANLQRFAAGEDQKLHTSVEDAWHTMALVEACYRSNASQATPVPQG